MRVTAFVPDLLDRSRVAAAVPGVRFVDDVASVAGADVVVVDLARRAHVVAELRASAPAARIVCFGPHVDDERMKAAIEAGADVALPRSRFFHDVAAAVAPQTSGQG